jgi:tagatose-6-phosphate ketose/aldose isomerase
MARDADTDPKPVANVFFRTDFLFLSITFVIDYSVVVCCRKGFELPNPLQILLDLPPEEKRERGLEHTPREIGQQPATWRTTYERCREQSEELNAVLRDAGIGRGTTSSPTVYLVGAGTSDYAGRALAPLLRRQWGCDVWAVPSTTLLTDFEDFHLAGREYLWISFSRSGDSPEGVALLERALEKALDQRRGIRHVVITCNARGQMAQLCERHSERAFALVLDDTVNDRGLAMTSSFSNMLLAGQCVGHWDDLRKFGEVVSQMAETGEQFLPAAAEVAAAVTTLGCARACFVGSAALRAVADESALKVVELSAGKVATLAETSLGLRHGPMSSVDGQTLFVSYLSSEARRRGYELDLLREIERKRLGRVRVAVTVQGIDDVSQLADYCLSLDCARDFADVCRPALDVMLGQLIGLFASMRSGLKPDQPSPNGAISRVVQPIKLYS